MLLSRLLPRGLELTPTFQEVRAGTGAAYQLNLSGPGSVRARTVGRGQVAITLSGTTANSQVTLNQGQIHARFGGTPLQITRIDVRSGALGSFQALGTADLAGPITPLNGQVGLLQFDALGPSARIEVRGTLGELDVARDVNLGPAGRIGVSGGLTGGVQVGGDMSVQGTQVDLAGGSAPISIGGNLVLAAGAFWRGTGPLSVGGGLGLAGSRIDSGPLNVGVGVLATGGLINAGSIQTGGGMSVSGGQISSAGALDVGGDLSAQGSVLSVAGSSPLTVGGSLTLGSGALIQVANDLTGAVMVGGGLTLDGGQFRIGRDQTGPIQVGGRFEAIRGGQLAVGRDAPGGLTVGGDLVLASAGSLTVGRDLGAVSVTGDLDTSGGGSIRVGGNLALVSVVGTFQGQGRTASDLVVGLNLGNLRVLGARPGRGSVDRVDIDVAKNIQGLDVAHGIFDSFITAGVLIDGGPATGTPGGNIGPDGPVAVFDSEIRAGVQIRNLVIGGDVQSDRPTNPSGMPARIVAGLDRQGVLHVGGNIDQLQITGSLIDAVLAAGVKPNGGDGTVSTVCTDAPGDSGFNTYDKPAGTVRVGQFGAFVEQPNFTAPPYDSANDPTIDDCVVPGSINAGLAPASLPALPGPTPETPIPLPSQSTVLGGIISSPHGDEADYAGIFATDTRGVFVGRLPQ